MAKPTPAQLRADAQVTARAAIGRKTAGGRTIEYAEVDRFNLPTSQSTRCITVRFAGTGLAPFREAHYTIKEVRDMIAGH